MKKIILSGLSFAFAGVLFFDPAFAQLIDPSDNPREIIGATGGTGSLRSIFLTFINFFLFFLGLLATAFVIYGGFLYITSQGEDSNTDKAKKILTYAAVGILITLASFAIINTVLTAGSGNRALT